MNKPKGFSRSTLFKVICGTVVVLLLFMLYNCVLRGGNKAVLTPDDDDIEEQKAVLKDTFDVLGDYLFPTQKVSKEDMMTDDEKKESESKKDDDKKDDVKTVVIDKPSADEIESADISSDPKPAPAPDPKLSAPTIEKMEAPKVTPIEQ